MIATVPNEEGKKTYLITDAGLELLEYETGRLKNQLTDGESVLGLGGASHE